MQAKTETAPAYDAAADDDATIRQALAIVRARLPVRLEYCTGQYFPTEYRAAACAVLCCPRCFGIGSGRMPAHGTRKTWATLSARPPVCILALALRGVGSTDSTTYTTWEKQP